MLGKRTFSALSALALIAVIQLTTPKNKDYTKVQLVNTDLMMLTISSFQKIDKNVQECTQNADCDK